MNIRESEEKKDRSLAEFINAKLNISVPEYSVLENTAASTLYDRWKSNSGKARIMDSVQRIYFDRYYEL